MIKYTFPLSSFCLLIGSDNISPFSLQKRSNSSEVEDCSIFFFKSISLKCLSIEKVSPFFFFSLPKIPHMKLCYFFFSFLSYFKDFSLKARKSCLNFVYLASNSLKTL